MPCSTTASPIWNSRAWWSRVRYHGIGTIASGWGSAMARFRSIVSAAGIDRRDLADVPGEGRRIRASCLRRGSYDRAADVLLLVRKGISPGLLAVLDLGRWGSSGSRSPIAPSSSTSCSGDRSIKRWNSHHMDLSSRRCQPSSWASSQRACCAGSRSARSVVRSPDPRVGRRAPASGPGPRSRPRATGSRAARARDDEAGGVGELNAEALQPVRSSRVLTTSSRL